METATYVTIAIFMAGVIYQAGRLSVRVEELEKWRAEITLSRAEFNEKLDDIRELLSTDHR